MTAVNGRENTEKATILMVEDNEQIGELRRSLLEDLGCRVELVSNAAEAINRLKAAPEIDLLLADVNLGPPDDKGGLIVATETRRAFPEIPIVAYSAWFDESELPFSEHPEIDRWFVKGSLRLSELGDSLDQIAEMAQRSRGRRRR
jgi:CheY-like chemotaxis protein